MNKPFALATAIFTFGALPVVAQTTTNLTYRIQVETVTAGVTNTVSTNWRYDAGGAAKDVARLAGVQYAYAVYLATAGASPLTLGAWLKQQHVVLIDDYSGQKQRVDYTALLAKITSLLTSNADLLSNSDLTSLNTIAAKAP